MRSAIAVMIGMVVLTTSSVLAQQSESPVVVKPGASVLGKANAPQAPANATKGKQAGKGSTTVNTANSDDDTDSAWVETLDIDGDGTPELTDIVWDDEDKVLFLHASKPFKCKNGGVGEGDLLIAINGKDNPRARPADSGFFVVSLDKGECGAEAAGLYGCRFDAKGDATVCGVATIDEKNDEITIVTVSQKK